MAGATNAYEIDVEQLFSEPKLWWQPPAPEEVFASFQALGVYDGLLEDIVRPLFSDVVCPDGDDKLAVWGYFFSGMHAAFQTKVGESRVSFLYASEHGVLLDNCDEVTMRASNYAKRLLQGPLLEGAKRINFYKTSRYIYRPVVFGECVIGGKRSKWLAFPDFYFKADIDGGIPIMGTSVSNSEWDRQIGDPRPGSRFIELLGNRPNILYLP